MAYTNEQLKALEEAIASGATRVSYADRTIQYHSLAEMVALRDLMKQELTPPSSGSRTVRVSFRRE